MSHSTLIIALHTTSFIHKKKVENLNQFLLADKWHIDFLYYSFERLILLKENMNVISTKTIRNSELLTNLSQWLSMRTF